MKYRVRGVTLTYMGIRYKDGEIIDFKESPSEKTLKYLESIVSKPAGIVLESKEPIKPIIKQKQGDK